MMAEGSLRRGILGVFCSGVLSLWIRTAEASVKCFKDEALGEYPINIYYCEDPAKPECCEANQEFTCCEQPTTTNIKEQLTLWGSVFGVTGLLAVVWLCYRKDTYMCEGRTLSQHFNRICQCKSKTVDGELSDINDDEPEPDKRKKKNTKTTSPSKKSKNYSSTTTGPENDAVQETSFAASTSTTDPNRDPGHGAGAGAEWVDSDSGRGSDVSAESPHRAPTSTTPPGTHFDYPTGHPLRLPHRAPTSTIYVKNPQDKKSLSTPRKGIAEKHKNTRKDSSVTKKLSEVSL